MENTENPTQSGASIQDRIEALLDPQPANEPAKPEENNDGLEGRQPEEVPEGVETPEGDEGGETEDRQIEISHLAEYLGVDESALDVDESGKVVLKTKIDGQEGKAQLKDLLTSYQLRGHVDNESRKVAEYAKALQQQQSEAEQYISGRLQQVEQLAQLAHGQLMAEFKGVDWQSLRANDPGEYSARLTDFQTRQAQINQALQAGQQERQRLEQANVERFRAALAEEAQQLVKLIPEWGDVEIAKKEKGEVRSYMLANGFTEQEADSISRAAYVSTVRKAMLYDKLQQSRPEVEKRVKAAPKLVHPGQAQAQNSQQTQIKQLKSNVKKAGGKGDSVIDYLLASGKV